MTDTEFHAVVDATLVQVEEYIESLVDTLDLDADSMRSGNVLTLDFEDKGKMILNSQVANHELWLAAKSGGFHYQYSNGEWLDTRSKKSFRTHFVELLSGQLGQNCPKF
ncbi:MAG: iron donor protein CyaY [Burkholderiales bacterium]|jgi:CyaY protein|uniref:iron donor protein CyaY n=1 Tax=Limnobacter sp. TaxID=2003368 RepID=UPI0039BCA0CB|nr:iron donor protein CyaY [Burkholderiales bacterium]